MSARHSTPITLRAAARRYKLNPSTLERWARYSIVKIIAPSRGRGYPIIPDEASVAATANIYHHNPVQGKIHCQKREAI